MGDVSKETLNRLEKGSTFKLGDSSEKYYDEWSEHYDSELVEELGYKGPEISVHAFCDVFTDKQAKIMDFGCGTGLVAEHLQKHGYQNIDGVDISEGMLALAKEKNIYQYLAKADLTKPLSLEDNIYDAGLCVGSMGAGYVEAEHVAEMLRVIKPEGLLIIFMNEGFYRDNQFDSRFAKHESEGRWQILKSDMINYMESVERPGRLIVGKKSI